MDITKKSPEAFILTNTLGLLTYLPASLWHMVYKHYSSRTSGVLTNVPGPAKPTSFCGRRISSLNFFLPPMYSIALFFGIITYAGVISVQVSADSSVCPDLKSLIDEFVLEIEELKGISLKKKE